MARNGSGNGGSGKGNSRKGGSGKGNGHMMPQMPKKMAGTMPDKPMKMPRDHMA